MYKAIDLMTEIARDKPEAPLLNQFAAEGASDCLSKRLHAMLRAGIQDGVLVEKPMLDVQSRFMRLTERRRGLRWYALIDGYQYEQHTGQRLERIDETNCALFDGTEDAPLAHAGPWLHDLLRDPQPMDELAGLEQIRPAISWLITPLDLEGLARCLRLKLDAKLSGGYKALLRFYDPRVLGKLFNVMTAMQRITFFELIDEWHFIYEGKRVWMGRHDA